MTFGKRTGGGDGRVEWPVRRSRTGPTWWTESWSGHRRSHISCRESTAFSCGSAFGKSKTGHTTTNSFTNDSPEISLRSNQPRPVETGVTGPANHLRPVVLSCGSSWTFLSSEERIALCVELTVGRSPTHLPVPTRLSLRLLFRAFPTMHKV